MASASSASNNRRSIAGGLAILGVVALWAVEVKLLKRINNDSCQLLPPLPPASPIAPLPPPPPPPLSPCSPPWHKPFFVGIGLKAAWVAFLPFVLLWRRTHSGAACPGSLRLTSRTVLCCGGLTLLVQGSSVSWVTSVPLTSASANSAIYQSSCALAYLFSLPLLPDEKLSASKATAVRLPLSGGRAAVICATASAAYYRRLVAAAIAAVLLPRVCHNTLVPPSHTSAPPRSQHLASLS